jgi:hypothetical protein
MTPPWYGTEKLGSYAQPLQDLARDLFQRVQALIGPHARTEEGSYSFERANPSQTLDVAAKLVIYQDGINRGDEWHPGHDGVYVLFRTRGNPATFQFTVALRQPTQEERRFAYFRLLDAQDRDEMARCIAANCDF